MVKPGTSPTISCGRTACLRAFVILLLACLSGAPVAHAGRSPVRFSQFDVFSGFQGNVPETSWFPIVCEIKNDGPTFVGTVEVKSDGFGEGQIRRMQVE